MTTASISSTTLPPPAHLTTLQLLPSFATGSKVRFLGCVAHYNVHAATLTLSTTHPVSTAEPSANIDAGQDARTVAVDARLVLETTSSNLFKVGAWVSVVGYVVRHGTTSETNGVVMREISVRAILIIAADGDDGRGEGLGEGGGSVEAYEDALAGRKEAISLMARARQGYQSEMARR